MILTGSSKSSHLWIVVIIALSLEWEIKPVFNREQVRKGQSAIYWSSDLGVELTNLECQHLGGQSVLLNCLWYYTDITNLSACTIGVCHLSH